MNILTSVPRNILVILAIPVLLGTMVVCNYRGSEGDSGKNPIGSERSSSDVFPLPTIGGEIQLPILFEENRGQVKSKFEFLTRGRGYNIFFSPSEIVFNLRAPATTSADDQWQRLSMRLGGANPNPVVVAENEAPTKSNYFVGRDPAEWRANVPNFEKIVYKEVYEGIDLVFYGSKDQIEYDFVVAPETDPSVIRFTVEGANEWDINDSGDLELALDNCVLAMQSPKVYQNLEGVRTMIDGAFELLPNNSIGFILGSYDNTEPLFIDPVLSFATFIGGNNGVDSILSIETDQANDIYIAGFTDSSFGFPLASALQPNHAGDRDGFIIKLDSSGQNIIYSTYVGGSAFEEITDMAIDAAGNVYFCGGTGSADFPVVAPLKGALTGESDAFFGKLDSSGSALTFSSYLGGSAAENAGAIRISDTHELFVGGETHSCDFPTTSGCYQPAFGGGFDAFLVKIDSTGQGPPLFSTFLGGEKIEQIRDLQIDENECVYVTGFSSSPDFPTTAQACQRNNLNNDRTTFVSKFNALGTQLVYSTLISGTAGQTDGHKIILDDANNAVVAISVESGVDFPITADAWQSSYGGGWHDAAIAKFGPVGNLIFSTFYGGNGDEQIVGLDSDSFGNIYFGGLTRSEDFYVSPDALYDSLYYGGDGYLVKLSPDGSMAEYATYIPGNDYDRVNDVKVDASNQVLLGGITGSTDFPIQDAIQANQPGIRSGFLMRLGFPVPNVPPVADAGDPVVVECTGEFTAIPLDGSGSYDGDGDTLEYVWNAPISISDPFARITTGHFPVGPTLVTLTVTDGKGGMDLSDVLVTVVDTTPPVLICTTDKIALWPPNHHMEEVFVSLEVSESCTSPEDLTVQCAISSNEPDDAKGDGATIGDVNGQDGFASPVPVALNYDPDTKTFSSWVTLRAERDGSETGRNYSIICQVADEFGNSNTASCVVVVPHDRKTD